MKLFFRNIKHDYRSPDDPARIGTYCHRNYHNDFLSGIDLTYLLRYKCIDHTMFVNDIKNNMYIVPYTDAIRYSWNTFHLSDNNGPKKKLKLKNKYRKL